MGLKDATPIAGGRISLPPGPPYGCSDLKEWAGVAFHLPAGDPRLEAIHRGDPAPTPPLDNLVGAARYWVEHPDWMEMLDPSSPVHHDKMVERALYLHRWERWLPPGIRALDLGGGVGRFTTWLLDRDCEVELVDPDLRSLWRAVSSAAGGRGKLDVHWTTGERLPSLAPVDVVIATEVLCYMEDPAAAVRALRRVLKPGGVLLCSVEARWGWAMAADAHDGTLDAWLGDGVVHVPGDRWIRTYEQSDFEALLSGMELVEMVPSHYACSGPFELAAGPLDAEHALMLEDRLRQHPVAGKLNRAWMAIAREPRR